MPHSPEDRQNYIFGTSDIIPPELKRMLEADDLWMKYTESSPSEKRKVVEIFNTLQQVKGLLPEELMRIIEAVLDPEHTHSLKNESLDESLRRSLGPEGFDQSET